MNKINHTTTVTMDETFGKLETRLIEANLNIDASSLKDALDNVKGTVITIGCGGSLVVANYLSKVLEESNIFSISRNSRDIIHGGKKSDSLFAFSYSGKSYGIHLAINHFTGNKYLMTCNPNVEAYSDTKVISLGYQGMDKEKSFISLASTLIPIGEFLKYHEKICTEEFSKRIIKYLKEAQDWINKLNNHDFSYDSNGIFEIMTGYDTEVASSFLESTLTESGLGNAIIHDKYDYCHGRSTIQYLDEQNHSLIYLINEKTELDEFLLEQLKDTDYYPITIIDVSNSNTSSLERQYELLIKIVFLCKKIAENKKMDLSQVNYNKDIVHKVYNYKGEM